MKLKWLVAKCTCTLTKSKHKQRHFHTSKYHNTVNIDGCYLLLHHIADKFLEATKDDNQLNKIVRYSDFKIFNLVIHEFRDKANHTPCFVSAALVQLL